MKMLNLKEARLATTKRPPMTVLSYGASRSGKTRFAATFPKPLFLSETSEGGYETIRTMPSDVFYDPKIEPRIALISNAVDYTEALGELPKMIQGGAVETIVTDSLTFYHDMYHAHLLEKGFGQTKQGNDDTRAVYGEIARHLRDVRIRVHNFNVNVVWLCLDVAPDDKHPLGGPMLSGQSRTKFSAGCAFLFYHRQVRLGKSVHWELHTANYGPMPAGGRDSGRLPQIVRDPTYRLLSQYLYEGLGFENEIASESVAPNDTPNDTINEGDQAPDGRAASPPTTPTAATNGRRPPIAPVPAPRPLPAPVRR